MSESVVSQLQLLESYIDKMENDVAGMPLGVRKGNKASRPMKTVGDTPVVRRVTGNAQDAFYSSIKAVNAADSRYTIKINNIFRTYHVQLNYGYLYDKMKADTELSSTQKKNINNAMVDYMAEDIMRRIAHWPQTVSQVSGVFVNELESFIRTYCKCRSDNNTWQMKNNLSEAITPKFRQLPNDEHKGAMVDGYIRAFFAAFDMSLYDD